MKIAWTIPDASTDRIEQVRDDFARLLTVRNATVHRQRSGGNVLVVDLFHRSGQDTPPFRYQEHVVTRELGGRRETRLPAAAQVKSPTIPRKQRW